MDSGTLQSLLDRHRQLWEEQRAQTLRTEGAIALLKRLIDLEQQEETETPEPNRAGPPGVVIDEDENPEGK